MKNHFSVGVAVVMMIAAGRARAALTTITIDNSNGQLFAVDPTRHLLYAGESSAATTKHLDVISTTSNTVVGNFSYSGAATSTVALAAGGTNVYWADQGASTVKVIAVSGAGTPTLTRNDSFLFPTGLAALATTYGANLQGGGDSLKIVDAASGTVLHSVTLSGTASNVVSDPTSNLYYAKRSDPADLVIDSGGNILRTLAGNVAAVDPAAGHHFVYFENGTGTQALVQLNGADDSATGKSFDFGVGSSITNVATDVAGDVWVSLNASNLVVELDQNMNVLQQVTVPGAEAIAADNGEALVHEGGTNLVAVIASVPEPGTCGLVGMAAAGLLLRRRRA